MTRQDQVAMRYDDTDTLAHYGVKGMRWGVRRDLKKMYNSSQSERMAYIKRKDHKL